MLDLRCHVIDILVSEIQKMLKCLNKSTPNLGTAKNNYKKRQAMTKQTTKQRQETITKT